MSYSGVRLNPPCTDKDGSSVMAIIVSLQRRLNNLLDGPQERQFFSYVLRYLTVSSGLRVELQNWMITPYEVEFGPKIGSGRLCVSVVLVLLWLIHIHNSGQVFLGTWDNTPVALKVLTTQGGIMPSSMVCCGINIADEVLMLCVQAIHQEIEVRNSC